MTGGAILCEDPKSCGQARIDRAAALIKQGGLVVFPTSSFYGLGADALNAEAVDRVFKVKKRDPQKPLLILIACLPDLAPLVRTIPGTASQLIEAFWPGRLTLIFEAADSLPPNLTGYTGKIGIRLAKHPVASSLVKSAGKPITGTSANLSGTGGRTEVALLEGWIKDHVDMVLDAGKLPGGKGSTVVDVSVSPPKIVRQGAVRAGEITAVLARRISL
jgi:L-threonylcarbamoyladenylate synthase